MSSKKDLRRKRQEQEEERARARGKPNPAVMFILAIVLALLVIVGGVAVFGDQGGPGEPPWPGAVWSPAHDHWH